MAAPTNARTGRQHWRRCAWPACAVSWVPRPGDLVLDPLATIGQTILGIREGGVDPHEFIPRMIGLLQEGRFPFDRLIETFPMSKIDQVEQSSLSGGTIKPVRLPDV
jgi:Zn-dependent alcohol dehydrogenase